MMEEDTSVRRNWVSDRVLRLRRQPPDAIVKIKKQIRVAINRAGGSNFIMPRPVVDEDHDFLGDSVK